LSRYGYANLVLEQVANDAGYTRGALYHLFANKEDLALAVVSWVEETWYAEMGPLIDSADPAEALIAVARGHAILCRRDIARVMMTLRVEFSGQDHPVGREVRRAESRVVSDLTRLITAARKNRSIPPGPPPKVLAIALIGAVEGLVIQLAGRAPFDVQLAERVVVGVLGLRPAPASTR
jgi:AcrR family transcriptional regulator